MCSGPGHVRKGSRPSVLLRDFELLMHDAPLRILWSWSLSSLTRVRDLDAPREVQGVSSSLSLFYVPILFLRPSERMDPEKRDDINIAMSFRELFREGQAENGRSLNALNLP